MESHCDLAEGGVMSIEILIRKYTNNLKNSGTLRELKKREFFRSPGEKRRYKAFLSERRRLKKEERRNHG